MVDGKKKTDGGKNKPVQLEAISVVQIVEAETSHSLSKSPPIAEKVLDPVAEKKAGIKIERDILITRVETEKKLALIRAWEESEKAKAQNRAYKRLLQIQAWEESKRAFVEARLKNIEETYEEKKAKYAEKMKNKVAEIHRAAEENRAIVEAKLGEDIIRVEERAEQYRTIGDTPKRLFVCFGLCFT